MQSNAAVYEMNGVILESVQCGKDLDIMTAWDLKFFLHYKYTSIKLIRFGFLKNRNLYPRKL